MASLTEISAQQLARLIGTPDCPRIIDVRTDEDFNACPFLIPGAQRLYHSIAAQESSFAPGQSVVVICHKGLKLSQGVAAQLRCRGLRAETLRGGMVGWQEAKLASLNTEVLPALARGESTCWVSRQRPKVDRVACPWLIRRFVDPRAQFLFVSGSQVQAVAERFDAIAFDVEGAFWGHRGEYCSFDAFLQGLELQVDALSHLSLIVRAADTDRPELVPEAAGLLAVSLGLSRLHKDDLTQLEAGFTVYDALYRWARDATDERHAWPHPK
ncbi:MAG: chromate resistance protein ChrB domain-containing protein [Granulosicoccaceae bacterium]